MLKFHHLCHFAQSRLIDSTTRSLMIEIDLVYFLESREKLTLKREINLVRYIIQQMCGLFSKQDILIE